MDRLKQQSLIRENCQAGWREGELMISEASPETLQALETDAAKRLMDSDGLDQNYHQGMWYAVSQTPLSIVAQEITEGIRV